MYSVLLVLDNQKRAGVLESNPYVFGISNGSLTNNHLSTCALMRKFSETSNVENSYSLRGTQLRKHLATESAPRNLNDLQGNGLANFMKHHTNIQLGHYRLAVPVRKTTEVLKSLQMGVGHQNETIRTENSSVDLNSEIQSETKANQNVRGNKDYWNNSSDETL
ncbi:unnamed protein product [Psylliodes chrysocephalus]|uniref:Uncharacterized protein n=1 Tax=Psylliodes chrysocephalus TaxID=3402493 RepID=A0A9P0D9E4_9CUCU|nr:unnamed protein product [Psylliodes chrysocephala]